MQIFKIWKENEKNGEETNFRKRKREVRKKGKCDCRERRQKCNSYKGLVIQSYVEPIGTIYFVFFRMTVLRDNDCTDFFHLSQAANYKQKPSKLSYHMAMWRRLVILHFHSFWEQNSTIKAKISSPPPKEKSGSTYTNDLAPLRQGGCVCFHKEWQPQCHPLERTEGNFKNT